VTALESREDRERGIDVGANAYLVKSSLDQSDLLEALRRLAVGTGFIKMPPEKIKVLVADDSPMTRMLLVQLLNSDPGIQVIGAVNDGQAALDFLEAGTDRPDVVIMDMHMPRLDGFDATRRIMENAPAAIIICTATADPQELAVAFRSMEAGAVACVAKPVALGERLRTLPAEPPANRTPDVRSQVVRRWSRSRTTPAATRTIGPTPSRVVTPGIRLIGIGASTADRRCCKAFSVGCPRIFAVPLLIVQHIAHGFLPGMVEWLSETTGLRVQIAVHGGGTAPGHAYVAPDDFHLGIGASGRIMLARESREWFCAPQSHTFSAHWRITAAPVRSECLLTAWARMARWN